MKRLITYAHRLADADMVFWLMPPLMALLIAGTLAQRWMGLWPAMDMFFGSFIIWLGPIPLPGAYILLGILSLNLTLKFLLKSEWKWIKSGIILTHLGALILLLGGLITSITARESYMIIPQGQETPFIYSYTKRELVIYEGETQVLSTSFHDLKKENFKTLPFTINITATCTNCDILKRQEQPGFDETKPYQSMAQFMAFKPKPREPQPENDLTGLEFEITGSDQDGIYIAFDGMPEPIKVTKDDKTYTLIFGKAQRQLPFSIALKDFIKDTYAGSNKARDYMSDIIVKDGNLEWPTRIEMNEPLRYQGYTFFQSSFEQTPDTETTILAVVENKGWLFPYLGSIVIGIGLLMHLILTLYGRKTP